MGELSVVAWMNDTNPSIVNIQGDTVSFIHIQSAVASLDVGITRAASDFDFSAYCIS